MLSDSENTVMIAVDKAKLLQIVGNIEDRIAAYDQNIKIAKVDDATQSNLAKMNKENSDED